MRLYGVITFLTPFFLLHFSLHLQAYTPVNNFTVSCGTTGTSLDGERTWSGDADSKYLSTKDGTVSGEATKQGSSVNQVPYMKARLSYSEFKYSFPVTTGPQFVRLFFYPADYPPSFQRSNASFSVHSNGFTLLNDFNASLNADAQNLETLFREYVVYVNDGESRLTLSFSPSKPNSYAFINGIEVLSMPTDLYYTPPNDTGFTTVGTTTQYSVGTSFALQTVYRIKVGGQEISAVNDTGLFRKWTGDEERYLIQQNPEHNDLSTDNGKRNITVNPDYVAPKELYRSERNMGTNSTLNKMINLTWEFPVDTGFNYVLRLHFCELDPNITDMGERKFIIYIASQLADERADVMLWTQKQKGVAVHRNYAVNLPKKTDTEKRVNLSLQMHPQIDSLTKYSDAFLNGLEIFKISEAGTNNLAGLNPDPVPVHTPPNNSPVPKGKTSSGSGTAIIGIVAGVVSGVVLIVLLLVFLFVRFHKRTTKPKDYKQSKSSATSKWGPLSFITTKSTTTNSSLPSDLCRNFSLAEIKSATNNFDEVFIVGVGGFGHVYKGYIDGGSTPVAIKRLKPGSQQGAHEFMNEIEMLLQLRHLHLVSLIGYCNESNEMILIYDFMARGTLRDHLYNTDNPPLTWKQRLQICIGAARGLHYLHTGAKHTIIHRDVKTTNILLDEKWVAKVSDFGLSRIGPTGMSKAHVSTVVKGSIGYLDPEYYKRQRLTEKSDVYSFGVVLFELLCARPPLIRTAEKKQVSLADWARHCYKNGTIAQIVDPTLKGRIAPECLRKFCEIGVSCLLDDGTLRPSMNDVVWMLEFALQLQDSAEQRENGNNLTQGDNERGDEAIDDLFSSGTSVGQVSDFNKSGSVVSVSTTSEDQTGSNYKESDKLMMSGTVFSEIVDPKPR
ncbi:hypothetical protein VNO78_33762 [Psophocarpus tetragonolobus]|uniref:Protein kinase domain-containing protein n=1 Tax=Psophocarpus tetragonolobus TaxID=3891 RepID=A0AAN9RPX9_PSOTE